MFTAEVVARATAVDEHEVLRLLSGELDRRHYLVRAHSIQRIDGQLRSQYRFRHILFQRYLYSSQDEVERVYAHERVGAALESLCRGPEQAAEIAVELALHFREARIAEKAVHYLRLAGDKALQLSAYQEARGHLAEGLKLLESMPESPRRLKTELGLQLSLGLACMGSYPAPDWEQAITRARELSQQARETDELGAIVGQLAIVHYVRANYREARELGQEALRLAEQTGDPLDVAVSHWYLGFIHFGMGEFVRAHAHLSQIISFYQPQRDHHRLVLLRGADAVREPWPTMPAACGAWAISNRPANVVMRGSSRRDSWGMPSR